MTTTTAVRALRAGQVFSVPNTDMPPALIHAISEPVAGVRFIDVLDPADGTLIHARRVLGLDRGVLVHDVETWHHHYTNITGQAVAVAFGRREEVVEPGGTLHYTGRAQPDVFPDEGWEHLAEPVVVESDTRPLERPRSSRQLPSGANLRRSPIRSVAGRSSRLHS